MLPEKLKSIDNLEQKEIKNGNLKIAHVGCVKFTLKA